VIVEDEHGKVLTATRLPGGAPLVAVTLARGEPNGYHRAP
jgi:hypothetical protein